MSAQGEFKKITTKTLQVMKRKGEKIGALTAYDYITAKVMDAAGVDLILVGDSLGNVVQGHETTLPVTMDDIVYHTKAVTRGVERAMVVADMPFMSYQLNVDEAFRNAGRIMKETLAGAVKLEGGRRVADRVWRVTEAGIPVMGHIGLTPQSIHQFGSYKQRGSSEEERKEILEDAKILEEAGAFAVVLEKIPKELAKEVTERLTIPTIGIGAGAGCDGQILVTPDMLGMNKEFHPRFVRHYARLADECDRAFRDYLSDVKQLKFPTDEESY